MRGLSIAVGVRPLFVQERAHQPQIGDRVDHQQPLRRHEREDLGVRAEHLLDVFLRLVDFHPVGQLERDFHEVVRLEVVELVFGDARHEAGIELFDLEDGEHAVGHEHRVAAGVEMAIDEVADLVER